MIRELQNGLQLASSLIQKDEKTDLLGVLESSAEPVEAPVDSTKVDSVHITATSRRLQSLQKTICAEPALDPSKIQKARDKMSQGTLALLSDSSQTRLASAENIAKQLIDWQDALNSPKS